MKTKSTLLLLLGFLFCVPIFAQDDNHSDLEDDDYYEDSPKLKDRFYVGGNVGFQVGTTSVVEISPLVGFKLTDDFSIGIGGTYQYYSINDGSYSYNTSILGGRLFTRYQAFENFFAHAEYEILNFEDAVLNPTTLEYEIQRVSVPALLVGAGYKSYISEKVAFDTFLLYDVLQHGNSPYRSFGGLVIRAGITIDL